MKTSLRLTALVLLALIVAACARETIEEPEAPQPPPEVQDRTTEPEVDRLDPRDYTDARNLDNSDSLLSERLIYFEFDRSKIGRASCRERVSVTVEVIAGKEQG